MSDAGFVIAGWSLTAVVLAGYTARLAVRIRRARKSLPEPNGATSR